MLIGLEFAAHYLDEGIDERAVLDILCNGLKFSLPKRFHEIYLSVLSSTAPWFSPFACLPSCVLARVSSEKGSGPKTEDNKQQKVADVLPQRGGRRKEVRSEYKNHEQRRRGCYWSDASD